jgi:hypothetical protein
LFGKDKLSKSFIITDFGAVDKYFLSSLTNSDVVLKTLETIAALLSGDGQFELSALEILVKKNGILMLQKLSNSNEVEIKKESLKLLSLMTEKQKDA